MSNTSFPTRNFEAIAWGAIFLWWGITELIPALPDGAGLIGLGLILLGVNAARMRYGVSAVWFSTVIGIMALVWGGLELAGVVLSLPFELPIFAILLIVLGAIILAPELTDKRTQS